MPNSLTYLRKQPAQRRASVTFEAIVEAAAHILREGGPHALTTNRVAVRAGVSIGSLYQYFPNKLAVVRALIEREVSRAEALRPSLFDDENASATAVMRAAVDWHFDLHRLDCRYAQHLVDLAGKVLPPEEQRRLAALRHDRIGRTVGRFASKKNAERAAFMVDVCLRALAEQTMRRHPSWLADNEFREKAASALLGVLDVDH
jgi:AcrR family transcriptional regulator